MSKFESAQGQPLRYFLIKHDDRVVIEAIPLGEVEGRKKSGTQFVSEAFDTQQMADAALDDYLGDTRAG